VGLHSRKKSKKTFEATDTLKELGETLVIDRNLLVKLFITMHGYFWQVINK
jgi:hypothetical protein